MNHARSSASTIQFRAVFSTHCTVPCSIQSSLYSSVQYSVLIVQFRAVFSTQCTVACSIQYSLCSSVQYSVLIVQFRQYSVLIVQFRAVFSIQYSLYSSVQYSVLIVQFRQYSVLTCTVSGTDFSLTPDQSKNKIYNFTTVCNFTYSRTCISIHYIKLKITKLAKCYLLLRRCTFVSSKI